MATCQTAVQHVTNVFADIPISLPVSCSKSRSKLAAPLKWMRLRSLRSAGNLPLLSSVFSGLPLTSKTCWLRTEVAPIHVWVQLVQFLFLPPSPRVQEYFKTEYPWVFFKPKKLCFYTASHTAPEGTISSWSKNLRCQYHKVLIKTQTEETGLSRGI